MKTKLFDLLHFRLRDTKNCKYCKESIKLIHDNIKAGKDIYINLRADYNYHGVLTHYHINFLKAEDSK